MGANFGVILANLYLFAYELAFLTQLADFLHSPPNEPRHLRQSDRLKADCARMLVKELCSMKRYIDDILGINAPTIFKLGSSADRKEEYFNFHGLYPPLALE